MDSEQLKLKTYLVLTPEQRALKPKQTDDFVKVTNTLAAVVKIQSWFKQRAACFRVQKLAQEQMRKVAERKAAQKKNPEEVALKEFVTQLKAKNLTPEAFFRICDQAYARRISKGCFRGALTALRLRLTSMQIKRLEYIFHEDADDGDITYEEYQHALEAYDVCGEKHLVGQGIGGRGYVKHEAVAMERLVDLLNSRGMDASELFNALDTDRSG